MDWLSAKKGFKNYLKLERSLSKNSIEAYLRDIEKLEHFLTYLNRPISPLAVSKQDLKDLIEWVNGLGMLATTQARMISGIKAFYKYLSLEDLIETDKKFKAYVNDIQKKLKMS